MSALREQIAQWLPGHSLLVWALILGGLGLWLRVSLSDRPTNYLSRLLGGLSLVLLGFWLPRFGGWAEQAVFWVLAGVAVLTAGTAISTRSPVYMALWFAVSLLATAGLFLFQGAQFVGFATIVVYAGAIVVVFLFVLMLAQPEGLAPYDRVSWSWFAAPFGLVAGGILLCLLLLALLPAPTGESGMPNAGASQVPVESHHVARLGGELYARHLIAVEVAGTLLLVALVGAIAIVIHGRSSGASGEPRAGLRIRDPGSASGPWPRGSAP
jgi:NADH-quinone oxidoreductase subunit J